MSRKNVRMTRKDGPMHDVAQAQELMREAFPLRTHGSVKAAVGACYDRMTRHYSKRYPDLSQWTIRRAETIWQGVARRVDASEMDALREERARKQAHEQATQFQQTIAHLRAVDENFFGPTIALLERAIVPPSDLDSPMD